jgi:short-subunit dehydrogenase
MKIKNARALITGANRGIGLALAEELAKRGAHLHLAMRDPNSLINADALKKLGAQSVAVHKLDMSNLSSLHTFAENFCAEQVPDILINNAGQMTGGLLEEQDPVAILNLMNVNLTGLILLTRAILPFLLKKGSGKILNNASVSGFMHFPCSSTYSASKAGVIAFTQSLKQELRGSGVSTLLMVTPGVKTRMFEDIPRVFGKNFDVDLLTTPMPAETWAKRVCDGIEKDIDTVEPKGISKAGVSIAKHLPAVFESFVGRKFHRSGV